MAFGKFKLEMKGDQARWNRRAIQKFEADRMRRANDKEETRLAYQDFLDGLPFERDCCEYDCPICYSEETHVESSNEGPRSSRGNN